MDQPKQFVVRARVERDSFLNHPDLRRLLARRWLARVDLHPPAAGPEVELRIPALTFTREGAEGAVTTVLTEVFGLAPLAVAANPEDDNERRYAGFHLQEHDPALEILAQRQADAHRATIEERFG